MFVPFYFENSIVRTFPDVERVPLSASTEAFLWKMETNRVILKLLCAFTVISNPCFCSHSYSLLKYSIDEKLATEIDKINHLNHLRSFIDVRIFLFQSQMVTYKIRGEKFSLYHSFSMAIVCRHTLSLVLILKTM